jgi:catechol 2,3-dioxygenase-like lactoylglutathione lyase family enzyme
MIAKSLTPILNVSNLEESFAWFEKLGWKKDWEWGTPPSFGAVCSGGCNIFLCLEGQGHRSSRPLAAVTGFDASVLEDQGTWISIWVDDVDEIHRHCVEQKIEITLPPTDFSWEVRELHVRHPDGHIFRISQALEDEEHG